MTTFTVTDCSNDSQLHDFINQATADIGAYQSSNLAPPAPPSP